MTIETFNVLEVPLSLSGSLPFVLLSLQLRLGLSAVSCHVTKFPVLTTSEVLASISGLHYLFPFLSNLILSSCSIIISQSTSFHTGLWLPLFGKNVGILRECVQELVNECACFHPLTCKVFKPCRQLLIGLSWSQPSCSEALTITLVPP